MVHGSGSSSANAGAAETALFLGLATDGRVRDVAVPGATLAILRTRAAAWTLGRSEAVRRLRALAMGEAAIDDADRAALALILVGAPPIPEGERPAPEVAVEGSARVLAALETCNHAASTIPSPPPSDPLLEMPVRAFDSASRLDVDEDDVDPIARSEVANG